MSLPLPGYVRRRRSCADSRRTGVVRRPDMGEERGGYLDTPSGAVDRPLLPRPRRPERALPLIDAAPTWTSRYWPMWATHVPLSPTSGLAAAAGWDEEEITACAHMPTPDQYPLPSAPPGSPLHPRSPPPPLRCRSVPESVRKSENRRAFACIRATIGYIDDNHCLCAISIQL